MKIRDIQKTLVSGEKTCRQITEEYLDRINSEETNSYITATEDIALSAADAVDKKLSAGKPLSSLEGVPFSVKDNIAVKGVPMTCASKMLKNYVPPYDAYVYSQLIKSGAVMLGKVTMDEFAMGSLGKNSVFGSVKNPHDLTRSAGGSSGGSAASVAADLAVFSLGSDTGGSIRLPSSFCGVYGLRPTYGSVSRSGLTGFCPSLDQIGIVASCPEDVELIFSIISNRDDSDMTCSGSQMSTSCIEKLTVGICTDLLDIAADSAQKAVMDAVSVFEKSGCRIANVSLPSLKYCLPAYQVIASCEASSNLARFDGLRYGLSADKNNFEDNVRSSRTGGFGREVKRRIIFGTYLTGSNKKYLDKAFFVKDAVKDEFSVMLSACDIVITPSAACSAPLLAADESIISQHDHDTLLIPSALAGLPSLTVPFGKDRNNMPLGVQLIGRAFCESTILRAAKTLEVAADVL